jgi:hypothetical protein
VMSWRLKGFDGVARERDDSKNERQTMTIEQLVQQNKNGAVDTIRAAGIHFNPAYKVGNAKRLGRPSAGRIVVAVTAKSGIVFNKEATEFLRKGGADSYDIFVNPDARAIMFAPVYGKTGQYLTGKASSANNRMAGKVLLGMGYPAGARIIPKVDGAYLVITPDTVEA